MTRSPQASALQIAARNYQHLVNAVFDLGGGDDDLNRLHTDAALRRKVAHLLVIGGTTTSTQFILIVNYDNSLAAMIEAGNYDFTNRLITTEHFPVVNGQREVESELFHVGGNPSTEQVVRLMAMRGLRPATMPELLAFGAQFPDYQLLFPVVALGAECEGENGPLVGYLSGALKDRRLGLTPKNRPANPDTRFLGVRV